MMFVASCCLSTVISFAMATLFFSSIGCTPYLLLVPVVLTQVSCPPVLLYEGQMSEADQKRGIVYDCCALRLVETAWEISEELTGDNIDSDNHGYLAYSKEVLTLITSEKPQKTNLAIFSLPS